MDKAEAEGVRELRRRVGQLRPYWSGDLGLNTEVRLTLKHTS